MRSPERKSGKTVRNEEGLTPKDKETVKEVMQRNDKALSTLSQM
jgi:hypothetical protein